MLSHHKRVSTLSGDVPEGRPRKPQMQTAPRKAALRVDMRALLSALRPEDVLGQARAVQSHVRGSEIFTRASGVSVYLSMAGEPDTYGLIKSLIEDHGRPVFIPKVTGKRSADMIMVRLKAFDDIARFPKNRWGIPEPEVGDDEGVTAADLEGIDLVLLPGVAFDRSGGRLGHGKGYYDCFVDRLTNARRAAGKTDPCLVGLALREQVLSCVPMEAHDRSLHYLLTADGLVACSAPAVRPLAP